MCIYFTGNDIKHEGTPPIENANDSASVPVDLPETFLWKSILFSIDTLIESINEFDDKSDEELEFIVVTVGNSIADNAPMVVAAIRSILTVYTVIAEPVGNIIKSCISLFRIAQRPIDRYSKSIARLSKKITEDIEEATLAEEVTHADDLS